MGYLKPGREKGGEGVEVVACMQEEKRLDYVLVKPVGSQCNLRCTYCFYYPKQLLGRMSDSVLHQMVKSMLTTSVDQVAFGWQGGEPTLAGLDFYKQAIEYELWYGYGKTIGNAFQTNGVLLNRRWIEFFREYTFLVGISIDGIRKVHDTNRRDADGKGTHARVEAVLQELLDAGVAVNTLSVITSAAVDHIEESFYYLKDLGITHMQFIPCLEFGPDSAAPVSFSLLPAQYGRLLCKLFDLWCECNVSIRFFENVLQAYKRRSVMECAFRESCGTYLVVEYDGSLYSCDFFVEPKWYLGNVKRVGLEEALHSETQMHFGRSMKVVENSCSACEWQFVCHGGCGKYRFENRFYYCEAYKSFFRYADSRLREMSRKV